MATIYQLKPRFQALMRPLAGLMVRAEVSANGLTLAALLLSALAGAAVLLAPQRGWPLLLLPPVLLVRMALNALDGMLAREYGQASRLGTVLNELGDVLADTALYLPLGVVPGLPPLLVSLTVLLGVIGEMAGVVAVQVGAPRRYEGPLGKSDRALAFGLLALLLGLGVPSGLWCSVALGLLSLLAAATIVTRSRAALQAI